MQTDDHVESPESKRRFENLLKVLGLYDRLVVLSEKRKATVQEVCLFHTKEYLQRLEELNISGGDTGSYAPMDKGGLDIALYAVGCGIELCDQILTGKLRNGYALLRPPGHHAVRDEGMGFCVLNNIAVAAKNILSQKSRYGIDRIAIVDFDVHHGNGT